MESTTLAARRGTYVVTYDVASRLQSFRSAYLTVPNQSDAIFESFHLRLFELLEQALPDVRIDTIEMSELRRKIWEQVGRYINHGRDRVVLSTCPELASRNATSGDALILNINRLFNADGKMIGHGPRPGYDYLENQFDELAAKIGKSEVVLIEDGAFTGGTLRSVLEELHKRGIQVPAVVIGFCCTRAKAVLNEAHKGELVIVNPIENLIDWIPDHDLIPFLPNCGRILGEKVPHSFMPIQTPDGVSCAYPFILPFGRIEEWASVPLESAHSLSVFCIDTAIEIFSRIGRQDGRPVTIRELLDGNSRVSLPVSIGDHANTPPLETEVVSFLKDMRKRLEKS
jgi:hypothetical protein